MNFFDDARYVLCAAALTVAGCGGGASEFFDDLADDVSEAGDAVARTASSVAQDASDVADRASEDFSTARFSSTGDAADGTFDASTASNADFDGFDQVDPSTSIVLDGEARTLGFSSVDGIDPSTFDGTSKPADVAVTFDSAGNVTRFAIDGETGYVADAFAGDPIFEVFYPTIVTSTVANDETPNRIAEFATSTETGGTLIYNTFGYWFDGDFVTGYGTGTGGTVSVGSFGEETTSSAVASRSGVGFYDGAALGVHVDPDLVSWLYAANVELDVDFDADTFDLRTFGTTLDVGLPTETARGDLDISGSGAIAGSIFSGSVSASDPGVDLSGNVSGRFFGPTAEELGGTYDMFGADGDITAAFGADDIGN